MKFFDRYLFKEISENELPAYIDLGRFQIIANEGRQELTYNQRNLKSNIDQSLLLEKNKNIQDIFLEIKTDIERTQKHEFRAVPLIQRITNKIGLTEFEKLLNDKIFHIEEVFRQPHYLLQREIEKVHVSRAKRIPSKSYQYLASHTEDWVHKSIVTFKPSRILNESLDLNFDIYENQLTMVFVERSLAYLNTRLKEVQDIRLFLREYEKLLDDKKYQKGWYLKIQRNLKLIGSVYEDEHFHNTKGSTNVLSSTEEALTALQKKLLVLRKTDLFDQVSKKIGKTIALKSTNVLVNHKHYRYVRSLWLELQKSKPELSQTEISQFEQTIILAFQDYCKSILIYCLKDYFSYELNGNYNVFVGDHSHYCRIYGLNDSETGIFNLKIGLWRIDILFVSSKIHEPREVSRLLYKKSAAAIYLSNDILFEMPNLIPVNPLDADSVERMATFIRKILVCNYLYLLNQKFEFKRLLFNYLKLFDFPFLKIDSNSFTYQIVDYPQYTIQESEILFSLENFEAFKGNKSRSDKEKVIAEMKALITDINTQATALKDHCLYCFHCGNKLKPHEVNTFKYIKCSGCGTLLITNDDQITLRIETVDSDTCKDEVYGMDCISFHLSELEAYKS